MFGRELMQNVGIVTIPPQDFNDSAVDSEYIDMTDYGHATVIIMVGDTAGNTFAITLNEATSNGGAGEQVLTYTNIKSTGQRLVVGTISGTFTIGETITGGSSSLTAELVQIGKDFMLVRCLTNGTTWTDGETLTGGTSSETAIISGTGQDEDLMLEKVTAPSSTFTVPAVTFKNYSIEVDAASLTDGYRYLQVALSSPGGAVLASGIVILTQPGSGRGVPMPGTLGAQKYVATSA